MRTYRLEKSVFFPNRVEEVFTFHTCMEDLCRLVPGDLHLKILNAPRYVKLGDTVQLRFSLFCLPVFWKARIIEYKQNVSFADEMIYGPFSLWRHEHFFEARDGGTVMTDRISYKLPLGILGAIARHLYVQSELDRIFSTRHKRALQYLI